MAAPLSASEARVQHARRLLVVPERGPLDTAARSVLEALRLLSSLPPAALVAYVDSLSDRQTVVLWFSVLLHKDSSLRTLLEAWETRPLAENSDQREDMKLFLRELWGGRYSVTMDTQAIYPFKYPSLCIPHSHCVDPVALACTRAAAARGFFELATSGPRGKNVVLSGFKYNDVLASVISRGKITALYLSNIYRKRPKRKNDMIAAMQQVCSELESSAAAGSDASELSSIQRTVNSPGFSLAHLGKFAYPKIPAA